MQNVIHLHETQSKTFGWAEVQDITNQRADLFFQEGIFVFQVTLPLVYAIKGLRCRANSF